MPPAATSTPGAAEASPGAAGAAGGDTHTRYFRIRENSFCRRPEALARPCWAGAQQGAGAQEGPNISPLGPGEGECAPLGPGEGPTSSRPLGPGEEACDPLGPGEEAAVWNSIQRWKSGGGGGLSGALPAVHPEVHPTVHPTENPAVHLAVRSEVRLDDPRRRRSSSYEAAESSHAAKADLISQGPAQGPTPSEAKGAALHPPASHLTSAPHRTAQSSMSESAMLLNGGSAEGMPHVLFTQQQQQTTEPNAQQQQQGGSGSGQQQQQHQVPLAVTGPYAQQAAPSHGPPQSEDQYDPYDQGEVTWLLFPYDQVQGGYFMLLSPYDHCPGEGYFRLLYPHDRGYCRLLNPLAA